MCDHGDEVQMRVFVPAHLSHDGKEHWAVKGIDRCIAPLVAALNDAGIRTIASCCGHGKINGSIILDDDRELVIWPLSSVFNPRATHGWSHGA